MNQGEIDELSQVENSPSEYPSSAWVTREFFCELFTRHRENYVKIAARYVSNGGFTIECPLFYEVVSSAMSRGFPIRAWWFGRTDMMPILARIYNEIQPTWPLISQNDAYALDEDISAFFLYAKQVKEIAELKAQLKFANSRIEHLELSPYPGPLYCAGNSSFDALRGMPRGYRSWSI